VIEWFNRTLKANMWWNFSANNTHRYIDTLDQLIDEYNNTKHGTIKLTPTEGSEKANELLVMTELANGNSMNNRPKFKAGDKVRISKYKRLFEKGYTPNWTEEIFEVADVLLTSPITYKLKDSNSGAIDGTFYDAELQETKQQIYRIEKIIRRKGDKAFVKWYGYPKSFNSWVPVSQLQTL